GTLLVFGGSNHRAMSEPQIFDPGTGTFQSLSIPGITPRAHHSATLLTDGRVLIGGGEASGQALALTEVWTPQTGALDTISAPMSARRSGHTATLLGDGTVLLWGGTAAATASGEVFDPVTANFSRIAGTPWGSLSSDPPQLAASLPAVGAVDVLVDRPIALRFSKPLRMDSATDTKIGRASCRERVQDSEVEGAL